MIDRGIFVNRIILNSKKYKINKIFLLTMLKKRQY